MKNDTMKLPWPNRSICCTHATNNVPQFSFMAADLQCGIVALTDLTGGCPIRGTAQTIDTNAIIQTTRFYSTLPR